MTRLDRLDFFRSRIPRYQKDIELFAREVIGFYPDDWLKKVFKDVAEHNRVTVKSGHGVGKTSAQSIIIQWFLACFPFPRIVATAPTRQQLHDVL